MLKLKLQYFGHLMRRDDSLEKTLILGKTEGRKRRGQQRMIWLDVITDSMDSMEFKQALGDGEKQGNPVCCNPWDHKVLNMTRWLNNNKLIIVFLPRSKCILTLCLQSPYTVILETKKIKSVTVSIFPIYLP